MPGPPPVRRIAPVARFLLACGLPDRRGAEWACATPIT